jgi:two-component system, OmpR family, response regulator
VINVLLIDDDRRHSELLSAYCRRFGIEVDCVYDGSEGLQRIAATNPDLVLLDVMLPGKDGFSLCREIRRGSNLPIIMLTARGDVVDRVTGLELGADDYIAKPFEPRELVARIQTVLRRTEPTASRDLLEYDGLSIDTVSRTVMADGAAIELTSMEYELLLLLASHPGRDYSRDEILAALRGIDAAILTRSVDILVSRLRAKLGDNSRTGRWIHTVWGRGYRFIGRAPP